MEPESTWRDQVSTSTGRFINPFKLEYSDISILDIAESLSKQCRFNGHCKGFYSVAEHSIILSRIVPKEARLWGLMHDASEAYVGDLVVPIKRQLPEFNEIEDLTHAPIIHKFKIPIDDRIHEYVKAADRCMGMSEILRLFPSNMDRDKQLYIEINKLNDDYPFLINCDIPRELGTKPWQDVREQFLKEFRKIKNDIRQPVPHKISA